jgi:hypothetical protein
MLENVDMNFRTKTLLITLTASLILSLTSTVKAEDLAASALSDSQKIALWRRSLLNSGFDPKRIEILAGSQVMYLMDGVAKLGQFLTPGSDIDFSGMHNFTFINNDGQKFMCNGWFTSESKKLFTHIDRCTFLVGTKVQVND